MVDSWIKVALGEYFKQELSKLTVPSALIEKSTSKLFFAQSCDGCAAECITALIFLEYLSKILKIFFEFLMST